MVFLLCSLVSQLVSPVRLVDKRKDARAERPGFDQLQVRLAPISKETLALSPHHRVEQEMVLIDQVVLQQRLDQGAAAKEQNVLAGLLLELRDLLHDVRLDER